MRWWTEINDVQSQTVVCSCWNKKMWWLILSVCVSGGTQNTIITVFVWSLTRLSTACRRTCSTWQWDNNLSIRNRGEISIPFLSFSLARNLYLISQSLLCHQDLCVFVCMSHSIVQILLKLCFLFFLRLLSQYVIDSHTGWIDGHLHPSFLSIQTRVNIVH